MLYLSFIREPVPSESGIRGEIKEYRQDAGVLEGPAESLWSAAKWIAAILAVKPKDYFDVFELPARCR